MRHRDVELIDLWDRANQACEETRNLVDDYRRIAASLQRTIAALGQDHPVGRENPVP
jgi:hypothetical protein